MAETVEEMATLLAGLRDDKAEIEERIRKVQDALLAEMDLAGIEFVKLPDGRTAAVVAPERTVIDAAGLKKQIGTAKFNKVSKVEVDRDKLEAAVQLGDIDLMDVAAVTTIRPTSPYVRFTGRRA
jgi:hypothetical protein